MTTENAFRLRRFSEWLARTVTDLAILAVIGWLIYRIVRWAIHLHHGGAQ